MKLTGAWLGWLRGALLCAFAAAAVYLFVRVVRPHYPLSEWLFWPYARAWAYCALFAASSFSIGHWLLRRSKLRLPLREHALMASTLGVLSFFHLVFLGGLLGILRGWFALTLPVTLLALGAPACWRDGRRVLARLRARRARGVDARPVLEPLILGFGLLGVALIYYGILSPRNIAFDSHFYHLGIAQQYAVEGAIRPFQEGWLPGALPHLSSVLYTWTLILPGLDVFGKLTAAAHLEFTLFLLTLAGIPVLVRHLAPGSGRAASWAALFLFPGIFVYDSSLSVAADHIGAFWAVPTYLAFRRAYRDPTPSHMALLAACLAGGMLTKYQAMYLVAFPALALSLRLTLPIASGLWQRARGRGAWPVAALRSAGVAAGAALGAGLLCSSPHWLKNWAFYGNPLFPYLSNVFGATGWVEGTPQLFADFTHWQTKDWVTQGDAGQRAFEALKVTFTFSFVPHDWPAFHGKMPIFGSLFTLSLALLPFLKGTRRTWALSAATHLGVFVWFHTYHQDRYLQILVPWMAAVTASTLILAWRAGIHGKLAASALVALQAVWGGDAFLIPTHAMTRAAPITTSNELLSLGYKKKYEQRFKVPGVLFDLGASTDLPATARVLLHEHNPRLGLFRSVVMDIAGWQYSMRYELMASPAELYDRYRALGVTHVLTRTRKSRGFDSLGADLRFFDFVEQDATVVKRMGEFSLYAMPSERPSAEGPGSVAYLGCGRLYERGLYELSRLSVRDKQVKVRPPRARASKTGDAAGLLPEAQFAVTDPGCKPTVPAPLLADFVQVGRRGKEVLWARKRSAEGPSEPAPPAPDPAEDLDDDEKM